MTDDTPLCRVADIPDGGAKGIERGTDADRLDLIVLRRGDKVYAYINNCPHQGTPLETFPDKFLDQTRELLICSTHGARFRVRDGFCVEGPCEGSSLQRVAVHMFEGAIFAGSRNSG